MRMWMGLLRIQLQIGLQWVVDRQLLLAVAPHHLLGLSLALMHFLTLETSLVTLTTQC
jgi:hypothetical protein